MSDYGEAVGHCSGGRGAQPEVLGTAKTGSGVPEPARRPGLSGSQAIRNVGSSGSRGRAENKVEALWVQEVFLVSAKGLRMSVSVGPDT